MQARADSYQQGLMLSSQGRHLQAITCFEQALAARPADAKILFALGNTARALGLPGPAESFFRRVLAQEPERLEALVNLANLLRAQGQFPAAAALLEPALARNPESAELNLTLGSVRREQGDNAKAAALYRAALAIDSNYVPALSNLADLLADDGDFIGARTLYDRALDAQPRNPQARLNRAVLHLLTGNLKEGWRDYAGRLDIAGKVPRTEQRLTTWTGGPLKKIRLLVRAEQGVGDQIMFASLFAELAQRAAVEKGSIILECEPRLVSLFARAFPDIRVQPAVLSTVNGDVVADYGWLKTVGGANAAVPMGSLPRYLRSTPADFPTPHVFLKPDPAEAALWKNIFAGLGSSPVTGICWRSGKAGGHRTVQYAPLTAWADFLRDLPGSIVSAQYDAGAEEIAELERLSGRKIFVPPQLDQKNELDRTAAMLTALDALVSAPTAVSWLGAGAGVKTFKILYDTSWTSFGQSSEPFAPSCRCIMPKNRGDWADVFNQTRALLTGA